jgi:hypothetical protein
VEEAPVQEEERPSKGFQRQGKTAGFKGGKDAEAEPMFAPDEELLSAKDLFLIEVVSKYNAICSFLKGYDRDTKEYLSYLLINLLKDVSDLEQVHGILNYLE